MIQDQQPSQPEHLRFPEFRDSGAWEKTLVGKILSESRVPSKNNDPKKRITVKLHLKGIIHREFRGTEAKDATNHFVRKTGQFIYGKQNIHKGSFGIIPSDFNGFETSQDLPAFDFAESCHPHWFFYYMAREWFYASLEGKMSGTGSKRLKTDMFYGLTIALPPLHEQKKIAACLSSLDELITAQTELLNSLNDFKRGLIQRLFPDRGENTPALRFPEFKNKEPWQVKQLGEALKRTPSARAANTLGNMDGIYPIYGASGLLKKVSFYDEKQQYIAIIKDGAGAGRLMLCPPKSSVLGTLDKLHAKKPNNLHFLFYLCSSQIRFKNYIIGGAIPHVYFKDYAKHKILLPPPPEQQKIADCLTSLDETISAQTDKLENFNDHKNGLMQRLFPAR